MRRRLLLAGLLDKLADLIDEKLEHKTDEERTEREIKSVCRQINLCLAEELRARTPNGEQRRILGMVT